MKDSFRRMPSRDPVDSSKKLTAWTIAVVMEDNYDLKLVLTHMERLLNSRVFPKTVCPSEAARALSAEELKSTGASSWRDLMPAIRQRAFELRDAGELEVLQKGKVLPASQDLIAITGPIRLRKTPSWAKNASAYGRQAR
jgi:hypothetical protein